MARKVRPECPKCGARIKLKALFYVSPAREPASLAKLAELAAGEPRFWGTDKQKRAIVKSCYSKSGPWIHFRVNGQDRLAYLKKKKGR